MRVSEERGHLILSDSMTILAAVLAVCAVIGGWHAIAQGENRFWVGSGICLLAALLTWRSDCFDFDPHLRRVSWTRRIGWRTETGSLPFSAIAEVRLEMMSHQDPGLWRIVLDTPTGPLPLVSSFSGSRQSWEAIAHKIRSIMARPEPSNPLERDLKGLLAAGRRMEAIAMHRTVTRATLTESKRAIEDLQAQMARDR